MKKFEVEFKGDNYDYVTRNMVTEYLKSAFTRADIEVKTIPQKKKAELVKHGHLINLPKALDPSEQPVKCSVCKSVTSLYHGYKPRYCSNCGAKFDEDKDMLNEKPHDNFCKAHGCSLKTRQSCCGCKDYFDNKQRMKKQ